MSLETQYADLKSAFEKYVTNAQDSLNSLKSLASNGVSASYDSKAVSPTTPAIDIIAGTDSILGIINGLATKIQNINYIPPKEVTNFEMLNHKVWEDQFCEKIEQSLSDYIDTMGIPAVAYQDSIFNADKERKLQTLNDLYELADAKVGARGFTYNNSQSLVLKLDAQQKYQFDLTQIGRDITKLVTEWARQNYQFAMEKGITLEQFHADFTYKYCTAFVEIYKSLVLASIERFKAEIAKYLEPIKALNEAARLPIEVQKINADVQKANAEIEIKANEVAVNEAIEAYKTNLSAAVQTFSAQITGYGEVARGSAEFVKSASRSSISIQK